MRPEPPPPLLHTRTQVSSRSIVSANERAMKAEKALADLKRELYEAKRFPLGKGLSLPAMVVSVDYPPDEPFICVTILGGSNCLFRCAATPPRCAVTRPPPPSGLCPLVHSF